MKLKLAAVAVLAVVGVGALLYSVGVIGVSAAPTAEYITTPAARGDVTDDIAATGSLEPASRTGLAFGVDPFLVADEGGPESPGTFRVTSIDVAVGDRVAAGDVLATADTSNLQRDLEVATNDLLSARINLTVAEDAYDDAVDEDDTDLRRQTKQSMYAAENGVSEAEEKVADLKAQIAGATLTAPVAGLVTEVNVTAGFDAPSGAAIVIDDAAFTVTTDVVESDLADVEVGQTADITIDAVGAELTGTVTAISPVSSDDSGSGVVSYPVTVTIDEAPADVHSGMSADVTITTASATDVLTVPSAALQGSDGDYRVRTLDAAGNPVATPVGVGLVTATTAEITSGLTEGQEVVIGTASELAGTTNNGNNGGFGGVAVPGAGPVFRQGGPGGGNNVQVGP